MISRNILFWFYLLVVSFGCLAQNKQALTPNDYDLWHTLKMGDTSADGIWTSYTMSYPTATDTLFLENTETKQRYVIPSGYHERILADAAMFSYMTADTLHLLNLRSGKDRQILQVQGYEFTPNHNHLLYLKASKESQALYITDVNTKDTRQFDHVTSYRVNPTGTHVAIVQSKQGVSRVKIITLDKLKEDKALVETDTGEFRQLTWNKPGTSLAYYYFNNYTNRFEIHFVFDISHPSNIGQLKADSIVEFPDDRHIISRKLLLSDDGTKVFFDIAQTTQETPDAETVDVWNSTDLQIPPKSSDRRHFWTVWFPESNRIHVIEDAILQAVALADNQNIVLLLDDTRYLPTYQYGDRYSDVYLLNLESGKRTKLIEQQLRAPRHLVVSETGDYIAYFKDKDWWYYDIHTGNHGNLTQNLPVDFNKAQSDRLDTHHAFGFGGWTADGGMLVYGAYDIWLFNLANGTHKRLTTGTLGTVRYRLIGVEPPFIRNGFFGFIASTYDIDASLLIRSIDTRTLGEGFGIYDTDIGYQAVVQQASKLIAVKPISKNQYYYVESRFDVSPRIMSITLGNTPKTLAQGNLQQTDFEWGSSKLITYSSFKGDSLKGALFYPAHYNPENSYPLVVSIYENTSDALHAYTIPTMHNYAGFNVSNFTTSGYFVLYPDISYEVNTPGTSALFCVNAAIDAAHQVANIDEGNMGIIGHSFGGFEVGYIISQTDRFKAAVIGAGVTDLLSFYLGLDSSHISNMERFESAQFRNQHPFTSQAFIKESPIMNVQSIDSPVLLWTGSDDTMVPPTYSIKMYAALWRLGKISTLLMYPDEPHVLMKPKNQTDLSRKVMTWFDYHLKNRPKAPWIYDCVKKKCPN
ncbi:S9 family peptidase [Bizionia sp.]|uniref:S9 family peptidase n=1 Tax=Bizionia sp. TaxID=1954480 RepID=UPI003A934517